MGLTLHASAKKKALAAAKKKARKEKEREEEEKKRLGPWAAWAQVTCRSCEQGTHGEDRDFPGQFLTWYKMKREEVGGGPDGCECARCTRTRLKFYGKKYKNRQELADARAQDKALDEEFLTLRKDPSQ